MAYEIICNDVVTWAEKYRGPPFHAILTDSPYGLNFMGKDWDSTNVVFQPETWQALAGHLHPGGVGMSFGGARTFHRMAIAIEDAGNVIHPTIFVWINSQGFNKSARIDRKFQILRHGWDGKGEHRNRPAIGNQAMLSMSLDERLRYYRNERIWNGHRYGLQAMAPKAEPVILFQKPYNGSPVGSIVLTGAGALNIDDTRLGGSWQRSTPWKNDIRGGNYVSSSGRPAIEVVPQKSHPRGRWPSNFALVHHPECKVVGVRRVKNDSGCVSGEEPSTPGKHVYGGGYGRHAFDRHGDEDGYEIVEAWECHAQCPVRLLYDDEGAAARYFYQADWTLDVAENLLVDSGVRYVPKVTNQAEREAGLSGMPLKTRNRVNPGGLEHEPRWAPVERYNDHPTLKPIKLTKWLATLLLPPAAYAPRRLLIPFAGVASEGIGALLAGWDEIVMVEMLPEYCKIGEMRMTWWEKQMRWGLRDVDAALATWSPPDEVPEGAVQLELFK